MVVAGHFRREVKTQKSPAELVLRRLQGPPEEEWLPGVGAGRRHCGWAEGKEGWVKIKNRKTKQRTWEFQRKPKKWQTDAIGSSRKGCRRQRTRGSVPPIVLGKEDPEMSTVGCTMQRLNNVLKITLTWELYQCWTSLQQRLRDWGMLQPLVHELLF